MQGGGLLRSPPVAHDSVIIQHLDLGLKWGYERAAVGMVYTMLTLFICGGEKLIIVTATHTANTIVMSGIL